MNIDGALIECRNELVAASGRWHRARRRRRRIVLATGTVAAVLVVAGAAVAATGWLVGTPAPPSVKSDFGSYAPQLGFDPKPGRAVLVASDGPYQLYATTNEQGTYCVLVSAPWKRPGPRGEGGDCVTPQTASRPYWAGIGGIASKHGNEFAVVVDGRTTDPDATSVRFVTPDGQTITQPIGAGGFFVAGADVHANPCSLWRPTFAFLDRNGDEVGRTSWQIFGRCVTGNGRSAAIRARRRR